MANTKPPQITEDRDGFIEDHESYGMIGISRQHGHDTTDLFGSSVRHNTVFSLRIQRADKRRHLNRNWYHGKGKPIVEVYLSPNQLVDMITSLNVGDGVPCTLSRVNGEKMDGCPSTDTRQQFEDEFADKMKNITSETSKLERQASELLTRKGTLKKAEKEELLHTISMLVQNIRSNVPFVQSSFNEAMDDTVTEAKSEVEAFFTSKVQSLGLEALQSELQQLLMPPDDDQKLIDQDTD